MGGGVWFRVLGIYRKRNQENNFYLIVELQIEYNGKFMYTEL